MNKALEEFEKSQMKKDIPDFKVGDTIRVNVKIVETAEDEEGPKTRTQAFEGVVISRRGGGLRQTAIVRKISYGEGVERMFQLHSPWIESIELVKKGDVCRAKLFYIRSKRGKQARIEEEITEDKVT